MYCRLLFHTFSRCYTIYISHVFHCRYIFCSTWRFSSLVLFDIEVNYPFTLIPSTSPLILSPLFNFFLSSLNCMYCLLCSVTYSCLQFVVMVLRFQGVHSDFMIILPSVAVILAWCLFTYLWTLLFLRARNSYNNDNATLSVKEYTFLVYSVTLFGETMSGSISFLIGGGKMLQSIPNPPPPLRT